MAMTAMRTPDAVFVWHEMGPIPVTLARAQHTAPGSELWGAGDTSIEIVTTARASDVRVRSSAPLLRIALRWDDAPDEDALVLGDAWERSYGDLQWMPVRAHRSLPWYWAAHSTTGTRGAGVRVRAGAMCSWSVDAHGVTLWMDVRSGPVPVQLGERVLHAATVVALDAPATLTSFAAVRELCAALCDDPLLPSEPVIGVNNWYYAYGLGFDADAVVRDAATISNLSSDHAVRPFSVIDAGWSPGDTAPGGPWEGHRSFSDMSLVAERIRDAGARPGLWFRPLLSREPRDYALTAPLPNGWALDPSRPETLAQVRADVSQFREWGYELIKHDFSTFDITGEYLDRPDPLRGDSGRVPADRSRTTAEILVDFYRTVRDAAGDMTIIGCNTVGHLAAGLVHVQRSGDDTSGRDWERTRRMGVNSLAYRLPQDGTFFRLDADCVPATPMTPWGQNRQFLDAIARTGTALFLSLDPRSRTAAVDADVRSAIAIAVGEHTPAEPLDWMRTTTPERWRFGTDEVQYRWEEPWGATDRADDLD